MGKYFIKSAAAVLLFSICAIAAPLPNAPAPQGADSTEFHRANDFLFGAVISGAVGAPSKPWIGLVAGIGAGIANEFRYGSNFNAGHLAVISAGSFASYALIKTLKRDWHHTPK
jgi:hypothetical protein